MERKAPTADAPAAEDLRPEEILARLFGTSVEEMRERPEAAKEKFAAVFRELAEAGKGVAGEGANAGGARLEATRELVARLKRGLEESGADVPADLEELPERFAALAEKLGGAKPEELAELLRGLASSIETPGEGSAKLDELAAWFESSFGTLVGFERRRRKEDARMQAEYREAAKRSIAASLREHGIQPLTTDPVAPRPAMKRQHLFWKEFAAAAEDLRALAAAGDVEKAQRRITDMLDSLDLELPVQLSLEDDEAVLAFMPTDDADATRELHVVVRDSPKLDGWRFVRGRRYGASR